MTSIEIKQTNLEMQCHSKIIMHDWNLPWNRFDCHIGRPVNELSLAFYLWRFNRTSNYMRVYSVNWWKYDGNQIVYRYIFNGNVIQSDRQQNEKRKRKWSQILVNTHKLLEMRNIFCFLLFAIESLNWNPTKRERVCIYRYKHGVYYTVYKLVWHLKLP